MMTRAIAPITFPGPRTLAVGETASFEVGATSATDDILVIVLSGAVEETRYLTLTAR